MTVPLLGVNCEIITNLSSNRVVFGFLRGLYHHINDETCCTERGLGAYSTDT